MNEAIVGRIEQLTLTRVADHPRSVDMSPTPELMVQLYGALKLSSCWCTEKVWYAPHTAPTKCSRCRAIEAYELRYGAAPVRVEGQV